MRRIVNEKRAIELFFRSFFVPNNPHHLQTRATKRVCERLCFFDGINDSKFSLLYDLRTIAREESERQFSTIRRCSRQQRHSMESANRGRARKRWTVSRSYERIGRLVSPSTPPPPNRARPYFFILPRQRPAACRPRFAG